MPPSLTVCFGRRVRRLRAQRGMSQAELAARVGITPQHVGVIERGEKSPTLETVSAIATALGAEPWSLLVVEPGAESVSRSVEPGHPESYASVNPARRRHRTKQ